MNFIKITMPRSYFRAVRIKGSMIPQVEISNNKPTEDSFYDAAAQLIFKMIYG